MLGYIKVKFRGSGTALVPGGTTLGVNKHRLPPVRRSLELNQFRENALVVSSQISRLKCTTANLQLGKSVQHWWGRVKEREWGNKLCLEGEGRSEEKK